MFSSSMPFTSTRFAPLFIVFAALAVLPAKAAFAQSAEAPPVSDSALPEADSQKPRYGPADGVWLTDDDGTRYWIEKIPKGVEGRDWRWADENHIRVRGGLTFKVIDQDESTFSIRLNERPDVVRPSKKRRATPEALEQAAATYNSDLPQVDSLHMEPFDRGLPRRGQWRQGVAVADMNRDGHADIVHGASRKGRPRPNIFLGDGEGQWRLWKEATYPSFPYDYGDVDVADFNGDGHLDLALGMHLKGLMVLLGDGAGGFVKAGQGIDLEIPGKGGDATTFSSRAIEVIDWNRDGRVDILALGEGAKGINKMKTGQDIDTQSSRGPLLYKNEGDNQWSKQAVAGQRAFGDQLALGDFNGDGRIDFLTATSVVGLRDILNIQQEDGTWKQEPLEKLRPSAYVRSVAAADLNGDSRHDMIIGYAANELGVWRTGVDVIYSTESGWHRRVLEAVESRDGIYALAVGDLNGDKTKDIVATVGSGETWVFLGTEDHSFEREDAPELASGSEGCYGYTAYIADLDGDHQDELVIGYAGEGGVQLSSRIPGCPGGGRLRAWAATAATPAPAQEDASR